MPMWLSGDSTGFVNQRRIVQRGFESLHRLRIKITCLGGGMVDTLDLKSSGQKCPCGFESRSRYISRGRVEVKLTGLITQGCASDTSGSNPAPATTSSYRIIGDYTSLVRTRPQFDPGYLLKYPDGGMVYTLV